MTGSAVKIILKIEHFTRCISIAALSLAFILGMPPLSFSETNKKIAIKATDLDRKEDELIRKEAALLKQLSSASAEDLPEKNGAMARIDPPSFKIAPLDSTVASQPNMPIQAGDSSAIIAEKERRIQSLSQEVSKLRNRLLLAETEVERLSIIIDERNRRQMSSINQHRGDERSVAQPPPATAAARKAPPTNSGAGPSGQDMQVVTVRSEKAHLRTGPGEENSPLMTVSRGTRLAVETRSGNWYRVISPAGTRAWVSAEVVVFGDLDPTRATRIGGFSPAADAFRAGSSNLREQ